MTAPLPDAAAGTPLRRLFVYNGGFLTQTTVRRILSLAGWDIRLGLPGPDDAVGVWGHSPTAPRGEAVARHKNAPVVRIEDAFLRSVLPGRDGEPPLGLVIDRRGMHYDPTRPSDLECILRDDPLDDTAVLNRARAAMADIARLHLSKYNATDPDLPVPDPGYVLVIDQTRGDAAVTASRCDANTFKEMLFLARTEHPAARIVIKAHPETAAGHRAGYYDATACDDPRITLLDAPVSPHALLAGAVAVYTVSSQLGFEAIMAGHRPVVMGQPFYMGWGLTDDRMPLDRRQRRLTRAQLFAGAMILYPVWFDPYRDALCGIEDVIAILSAQSRAWRDDRRGWMGYRISMWKRGPLQQVFGRHVPMRFARKGGQQTDTRRAMIWASKAPPDCDMVRIEDGFLRSRGLGADLVAPLSLVLDDLGIYYDPTRPSRLEQLITEACTLPAGPRARADRLVAHLQRARLSKYNVGGTDPLRGLPVGRRILVPGQVADDASVRLGAGDVADNAALLRTARAANPAAVILFKPHPDVEAGLRDGAVPDALTHADAVLTDMDAVTALDLVDEVWTMTSTIGFEALLRGKRVTCLGTPFYAGWGLTDDRAMPLARRAARPDLAALVHAVLIDYPRYHDPVTGLPCPVEVVVDRLADGDLPAMGRANRLLAKAQGVMASQAWIWRR